jgi:hypothetical protein
MFKKTSKGTTIGVVEQPKPQEQPVQTKPENTNTESEKNKK